MFWLVADSVDHCVFLFLLVIWFTVLFVLMVYCIFGLNVCVSGGLIVCYCNSVGYSFVILFDFTYVVI